MSYRIEVAQPQQLRDALKLLNDNECEFIYVPMSMLDGCDSDRERIIVVPPVYLADCEDKVRDGLRELKRRGYSRVLAHTIGHVELITQLEMTPHGGFRLNVTNSAALEQYEKLGVADATLSVELALPAAKGIKHSVPVGLIAYGNIPLMTLRRCPIKDGAPCNNGNRCGKKLRDRLGNEMKLLCSNTVEVLNPDPIVMSDKNLSAFDFVILKMTYEEDIKAVLRQYVNHEKPTGRFTRGLYGKGSE